MIERHLEHYHIKGDFSFKATEDLMLKCNAPTNYSGIYLIYYLDTLIYVRSSGQKKDGILKTRKSGVGGMKDRIVNGYHPKFGKVKRKKIFPLKMQEFEFEELKFKWFVTYDNVRFFDFPTDVESKVLANIKTRPIWHK
ncbi:hypothetical protein [Flavobacterium psychrotrophum]|uniref:hypothetical protein n=1 Tax=Flavobacterium psychrotrophum TaxID=2294119 RepID=UPI000E315EAD|nr:hypothetical protein [Flavobacterium psychrotrophum]